MRWWIVLLAAGSVVAPLAGCTADGDRSPGPAPSWSGSPPAGPTGGPGTGSTGGPGTGSTGGPGTGSTSRPPTGNGPGQTPVTPPPGPGELPGELPHSDRLLTGVVERSGDCTMLRVGARLWGLTGTLAEKLVAGERVTVAGQIGSPDPACADSDLLRSLVVRRVT